jgi:sarcosine oxidase, subunit alpha
MPDLPRTLPAAPEPDIRIEFEGREIPAVSGEPVAVALLRAGERVLSRSVKYHRPRGLFCFAEHCASCLMRIDGEPDRFACTAPCRDGLEVARQNAFPSAGRDVLRAVDWTFPHGFDHHEMLAGVPLLETAMAKVARHLAGLGELPDRIPDSLPTSPERRVAICVVGQGRAGRAAALAASSAGADVLALEAVQSPSSTAKSWSGARVLGVYRQDGEPVLAVRFKDQLWRILPRRLLLCTGSRDQNLIFTGNDLPGIMTGGAVRRLLRQHRLLPSPQALVAGDGPLATRTALDLAEAGAEVLWAGGTADQPIPGVALLPDHRPVEARGGSRLRWVRLEGLNGAVREWRGGLLAACPPRAAAFELGVQAGLHAEVVAGRGFALRSAADGATGIPWLFAAGSCTVGPWDSEAHGAAAGTGAARGLA